LTDHVHKGKEEFAGIDKIGRDTCGPVETVHEIQQILRMAGVSPEMPVGEDPEPWDGGKPIGENGGRSVGEPGRKPVGENGGKPVVGEGPVTGEGGKVVDPF